MVDIVVTEFMDEDAVADLARDYAVLYDKTLVDRPDELRRCLATARALIVRNRTQVRQSLLDSAPQLIALGRLGVGLDNIDVEACETRGIAVLPATGANNIAVAEWVIAALLILFRGAYGSSAAVLDGGWPRERLMGREIYGKTLGLVGFGAIARETALRARGFGVDLIAADPLVPATDPAWQQLGVTRVGIDDLVARSDAISLHIPLTSETQELFGKALLSRMKRSAFLINAARGGVVDESALAAALREGTIAGAALDVFETEPLAPGSPLSGAPNLLVTPHIAGVSQEANVRVSAVTAANVRRVLQGAKP